MIELYYYVVVYVLLSYCVSVKLSESRHHSTALPRKASEMSLEFSENRIPRTQQGLPDRAPNYVFNFRVPYARNY